MITSLTSAILTASLALPTSAFALTIDTVQVNVSSSSVARATTTTSATSSVARAVTSSSVSQGTAGVEPDEIDVAEDPQEAGTDYLLELGGVDGESTSKATSSAPKKGKVEYDWKVEEGESAAVPGVEPDEIDVQADPQEASVDYFMKIDTIEGESGEKSSKSSSAAAPAPGVEPDEIDVNVDPEPLTPDFGILLGGGSDDDGEEEVTPLEELILNGIKEEGAPAETLSLNYEKIKTKATQPVSFLGLIPMTITATVEVDEEGEVEVNYPWWSFLVGGKDGEALGQQIFSALSNVLKTKHDTIKNSVGNVR